MSHFEVFSARDLFIRDNSTYPPGDNKTDTNISGVHLNASALSYWNYTFFPGNNTISNGSDCYLTFSPYQPAFVHANGSFVNATSCYSPINSIGVRGFTGIGVGVTYGLAIVLTLVSLAKHGALHLPTTRRFYPIGRRWQWYWACFVSACALVSLFTNVDIERYYLQDLPIILSIFFWFLLCQGSLALVWEAVRHWGSWLERQYVDPNPFVYREDDRRAKIEFWLPLWFYFWVWMNFFMVVPRDWNFARSQQSPEHIRDVAIPNATSARFKAGGFCLVIAWFTILFSLRHSIRHYKPRHRGIFNKTVGFVQSVPLRFVLMIPLAGALIAYQILITFIWDFSLVKAAGANVPVVMAWGYGPSLLILYVQIVYGFAAPNEDRELLRQRRERGDINDRELGIVRKPAWWRRVRGDHLRSMRDKIHQNVNEVGGKRGVGRRTEDDVERDLRMEAERSALNNDGFEMKSMRNDVSNPRMDRAGIRNLGRTASATTDPLGERYMGKNERRHAERITQNAAGILFPNDAAAERARRAASLMEDGPPPPYPNSDVQHGSDTGRPASAHRSNSTSTTQSINAQPQQIRSMLDI
ncbi:hypothetical protein QQS21_000415 [Conoideocrella luteorostrata]|uniref:Uncharacterized protein n=1 Tax=Conoideocrella luteorostrata TaxID=1105319 RepID=A0AAJ0CYW5_9HYPO|nr:hypothetical protein QQS21_000415 [Conoideocrella luteorostrata]